MAVVSLPASYHSFDSHSTKRRRMKLSKFFGELPPLDLVICASQRTPEESSSSSSSLALKTHSRSSSSTSSSSM